MQSDCCWYGLPTFANSVANGKVAPKGDIKASVLFVRADHLFRLRPNRAR
jgi:hypothetical protein